MNKFIENQFPSLVKCNVAVIGLGYVGLPLAIELEKTKVCLRSGSALNRNVIAFDISENRISELKNGFDRTNEISKNQITTAKNIIFTSEKKKLIEADIFIITVPTPIDDSKRPDLSILEAASLTVGEAIGMRKIKSNTQDHDMSLPIIVYESTVYPGATEEICIPIIEKFSKSKINIDFVCGYSPERINPGDLNHKLSNIVKVTSGSNPEGAKWIDDFYGSIIGAGTHLTSSIKVAEAAKVIENTQRDLNIALVNELAIIFEKMNIDTLDVLKAAGTKWNFLSFQPGLVGGHCIGVDPYYLTSKAESLGYYPQVVLAGRRINDGMGKWIVEQLIKEMARKKLLIGGAEVLILGLTFKENCPDLRNTRVVDIIKSLASYGIKTVTVDPWADTKQAKHLYDLEIIKEVPKEGNYSAAIVAVSHHQFYNINPSNWNNLLISDGILYDLKGVISRDIKTMRL